MNTSEFKWMGEAKKPFEELNEEELKEVQDSVLNDIRQRAWAAGSPVYYGLKGLVIAEYANGKRMVVETVNGERMETREYEERE